MYTTTFYSFKGGVGRTQALVNVGVELANRGRRVLLVDFDLEAPGVDTFPLPRPQRPTPGIVEFVTSYRETGEAPDASKHIYESLGVGRSQGRLWIMPAGVQDGTYAKRLSDIDWQQLYAEEQGYLLFEDLKRQWKRALEPDYVLIDSRTGHSDIAGICTRQLPDGVVILFFPTDQNLRGLPKIVDDIRSEGSSSRKKAIVIDFVMSNIPDLDDEDQILEQRLKMFSEALKYDQISNIVHRYDSLALLNQLVFTADRPKSRLSREYRALADTVADHNLDDREAALKFVTRLARREQFAVRRLSRSTVEERLTAIRANHFADAEILERIADLRMREGRFEDALALWTELVGMGTTTPHVRLRRAEARRATKDLDGAIEDVNAVLQSEHSADFEVSRALRLLSSIRPDALAGASRAPAIRHLAFDARMWLVQQLQMDETALDEAIDVLQDLLKSSEIDETQRGLVTNELSVSLIGAGSPERALELLDNSPQTSVAELFNRAMALWAVTGRPDPALFAKAIDAENDNSSANYAQCLAVALVILGRKDEGLDRLHIARERLQAKEAPTFSCWRYRIVTSEAFLADLDEIRRFADDAAVLPPFVSAAKAQPWM